MLACKEVDSDGTRDSSGSGSDAGGGGGSDGGGGGGAAICIRVFESFDSDFQLEWAGGATDGVAKGGGCAVRFPRRVPRRSIELRDRVCVYMCAGYNIFFI